MLSVLLLVPCSCGTMATASTNTCARMMLQQPVGCCNSETVSKNSVQDQDQDHWPPYRGLNTCINALPAHSHLKGFESVHTTLQLQGWLISATYPDGGQHCNGIVGVKGLPQINLLTKLKARHIGS